MHSVLKNVGERSELNFTLFGEKQAMKINQVFFSS